MSLKERVEEILATERVKSLKEERRNKEENEALNERYNQEFSEARTQQAIFSKN